MEVIIPKTTLEKFRRWQNDYTARQVSYYGTKIEVNQDPPKPVTNHNWIHIRNYNERV